MCIEHIVTDWYSHPGNNYFKLLQPKVDVQAINQEVPDILIFTKMF